MSACWLGRHAGSGPGRAPWSRPPMLDERIIDALGVLFGFPALVVALPAIPFALARGWDWLAAGHRRRPLRLWDLALAVTAVGLALAIARPGGKTLVIPAAVGVLT